MKTPEEIKKGLGTCGTLAAFDISYCDGCPYDRDDGDLNMCITTLCADALTYIQQLENELNRLEPKNRVLKGDLGDDSK